MFLRRIVSNLISARWIILFSCASIENAFHGVDVFVGTVAVFVSFPFIFLRCFACSDETSMLGYLVYYSPFIAIFQFGWAFVQTAHMALISQLTQNKSQKTELNGMRCVVALI